MSSCCAFSVGITHQTSSYAFGNPSPTRMAGALLALATSDMDGWDIKGLCTSRDSRQQLWGSWVHLQTATELLHGEGTHCSPSQCCKTPGPYFPAPLCKPRVKCFKAIKSNSLFPGISGCLGWKAMVVHQEVGVWGWRQCNSCLPKVLIDSPWSSWRSLDPNKLWKCVCYFKTKIFTNGKIK